MFLDYLSDWYSIDKYNKVFLKTVQLLVDLKLNLSFSGDQGSSQECLHRGP